MVQNESETTNLILAVLSNTVTVRCISCLPFSPVDVEKQSQSDYFDTLCC